MPTIGYPKNQMAIADQIRDLAKDIVPSWARLVPSGIFPDQWLYVNDNDVVFVLIDVISGEIALSNLNDFEWVIKLAIAMELAGMFGLDLEVEMVRIYLSRGPSWITINT
jgi:hypothetical protein